MKRLVLALLAALPAFAPALVLAQAPVRTIIPDAAPAPADPLADFGWMRGCWRGAVNQREFTEHWTAPAAGMMLGLGHSVQAGKTTSFEFMRIVAQPDGKVVYSLQSPGQKEAQYTFSGTTKDQDMTLYNFSNPEIAFPAKVTYRSTPGGLLFAEIEGKVDGAERKVTYPYRPVDCLTGKIL
jgi:hypothetical protein